MVFTQVREQNNSALRVDIVFDKILQEIKSGKHRQALAIKRSVKVANFV